MAGWGGYFDGHGLRNQASSGQTSQMGMGPFESSGSSYTDGLADMLQQYRQQLANSMRVSFTTGTSTATISGVSASSASQEPSLDDGLLFYLRARKKAWLDGVKVK